MQIIRAGRTFKTTRWMLDTSPQTTCTVLTHAHIPGIPLCIACAKDTQQRFTLSVKFMLAEPFELLEE